MLVVAPYDMAARMAVEGHILDELAEQLDACVTLSSRTEPPVLAAGSTWEPLPRPRPRLRPGTRRGRISDLRFALGFLAHMVAVHRFNRVHGFEGFTARLSMSRRARTLALREMHPVSRAFGWPSPKSVRLLRLATWASRSLLRSHPDVAALLGRVGPDVVLALHVQNPWTTVVAAEAGRQGIPVVGMIGSWDQPTTKGPLVPDVWPVLVPSQATAEQLIEFHGLIPTDVRVVGWPLLDGTVSAAAARQDVLDGLGLEPKRRYVLFGAYGERLGAHEPGIARLLASAVHDGRFGDDVSLVIRPHPLDTGWERSFGRLHAPPEVVVAPAGLGGVAELTDLLRHAAVVLATAGTICIDAVAVDTPAIGIGFAPGDLPALDDPAPLLNQEHYREAVETGGVEVACGPVQLLDLVHAALCSPASSAEGRRRLRERLLEPLDGRAAVRVAAAVREVVG